MPLTDVKLDTQFNVKPHPEANSDEVFLTNSQARNYQHIGWETKRRGSVPYDTSGKVCGDGVSLFPVFVKRHELISAGFTFVE